MLMAHKQSYVTVMLNRRRYSSEIAVADMSTVILDNTFKALSTLATIVAENADCRRIRRLSPKTPTVAKNGDCRRIRRLSPKTATVAEFGDKL